jgi:dephospho-CoA kinase
LRVALTGGIGMGKTTVLDHVAALGVPALSADAVVAELWTRESVLAEIAAALRLDGPPSRDVVRARIAFDPSARRALNRILHGRALEGLSRLRHGVAEVPLLIESCTHHHFDRVWVLACDPAVQLRRVAGRLGDEAQARALIRAQIGPRCRETFADRIVRTDAPLSHVQVAVGQALVEDGLLPAPPVAADT